MQRIIFILGLVFFGINCSDKRNMQRENSPLAIVIKLQAAEFLMDYAEAKNYIDITSVYGGKNTPDSVSAEKAWVELTSFMANSTDKKFTRQFKYYDYDVIEATKGNKAEVHFKPKNKSNKGITYKLELRDNRWIVYEIDHRT